ncbi:MAG: hypothetical protein WCP28_16375, partial [Actinomycetes bacterium]
MTAGKSTMLSNATALMTATIATSVIGIFFWALSVRLYDTANVGLATAQISAATLVAMVGQLSLGLLLTRFLPTSGRFTPWILKRVFIVVSGLSTVLAAAFVALGFANDYLAGWPEKLFFIVAVPALALFMLQDSALLGLGSAKIIPVENVLFSVAKLILLPVFAGVAAAIGIFASWVIPAGLAVVGVLIYIKVKHLSNPETLSGGTELPQRSVLWPMLGKQFVGTMVAQAQTSSSSQWNRVVTWGF